ncbi:hypothetical protein MNEG_5727 [Monoraphidium neglectum]|uniref:Uncharacterized protein n=1 Tax=Monoraphidium neglectum TaxID=145388 RepID=A0A0D2MP03_9CHLO|nr:hypothetical protein MNEG_5727 [Monoraphidium neglectum]KIZ02232.1 hypothetical protein MNEG_5727 [Monoraphidium neglectum]|eukprot:XP_013901251.1 hypothetical protein MNEG_5727 [Monoraphidium neglectum]
MAVSNRAQQRPAPPAPMGGPPSHQQRSSACAGGATAQPRRAADRGRYNYCRPEKAKFEEVFPTITE